jgi:hypothetical protein
MVARFTWSTSVAVLAATLVAAGACESGTSPLLRPSIEYVIDVFEVVEETPAWSPTPVARLGLDIGVVNEGYASVALEWTQCSLDLFAYGPDGDAATWQLSGRHTWPHGSGYGCIAAENRSLRLGPGESAHGLVKAQVRLAEILADSLQAGPYAFRGVLDFGLGPDTFDIGVVTMPETRFPLPPPPVYRDGFEYVVLLEQEPTPDGSVTVRLTMTNTIATTGATNTFPEGCPLRLLAFPDAISQTTIPEPTPTWIWPESCGDATLDVRLELGESREFAGVLSRAELLGSGVPVGSYALTGMIVADERPLRIDLGSLQLGP